MRILVISIMCLLISACKSKQEIELNKTVTEFIITTNTIANMNLEEYRKSGNRKKLTLDSLQERIDSLSKSNPLTIEQLKNIIDAKERGINGIELRGKEQEIEVKKEYLKSN